MDWNRLHAELLAAGLNAWLAAPLREYTTFQLGGCCPLLVDCARAAELVAAWRLLRAAADPLLIGGGSNLLVADAGIERPVIRYAAETPEIALADAEIRVSGATSLDALAAWGAAHGAGGLENCSGIPGTVGGAVVGNAGAFGWQLGDAVTAVEVLTPAGAVRELAADDVTFAYRHSSLREAGYTVLTVRLRCPAAPPAALLARREEILALRREKHPDWRQWPCAGSFFRNLEPTSAAARRQAAGYFLEEAGAKQMRVGGAGVFPKHANIIIKLTPECTAGDVHELSCRMADAVRARFGFELSREVQLLGAFA